MLVPCEAEIKAFHDLFTTLKLDFSMRWGVFIEEPTWHHMCSLILPLKNEEGIEVGIYGRPHERFGKTFSCVFRHGIYTPKGARKGDSFAKLQMDFFCPGSEFNTDVEGKLGWKKVMWPEGGSILALDFNASNMVSQEALLKATSAIIATNV